MPHRTCNTSANAMYLDWLRRSTGRSGISNDDVYLATVFKYGDTIYHGVQTAAIKHWGWSTKWMTDKDLPFIYALLGAGFPVVVNILHRGHESSPRGGHVIMLIGMSGNKLIAHDPYGTLNSNYRKHDGSYSIIMKSSFKKRWEGGYRILA